MEKKYLVYKVSGGLCHMLWQINNAIHLSKQSNRFLIIDCLGSEAFKNDFNKYFNIPDFNYATNYDCLYEDDLINNTTFESNIELEAACIGNTSTYVLYNRKTYTPNDDLSNNLKINISFIDAINNNDKIIYTTWTNGVPQNIPWYIRVNKDILNKISVNKIIEKYIGVHYRNCDVNQRQNIEDFTPKILELSTETNIIYLATDDYTAFDRLTVLLGDSFKIIQYTKPINNGGRNLHHQPNQNYDEIITNSLTDMYYLTYSTYFIPSLKSGWYQRITELRKNDNFFN